MPRFNRDQRAKKTEAKRVKINEQVNQYCFDFTKRGHNLYSLAEKLRQKQLYSDRKWKEELSDYMETSEELLKGYSEQMDIPKND